MSVLAACSSGDCPHSYESGDKLAFVVGGGTYSATCFEGLASNALSHWAYIEASPPPDASGIAVEIGMRTQSPCSWAPHVPVSLASSCVDVQARELVDGDSVHPRWTALGGYAAFTAVSQGAPHPTGSLTVDAWATGPGQPLAVTFSSDAALLYPPSFEDNGPVAALAPVSGSVVTVTWSAGE